MRFSCIQRNPTKGIESVSSKNYHFPHNLVAFKEIPQRELRAVLFWRGLTCFIRFVAFKEIPQRELRADCSLDTARAVENVVAFKEIPQRELRVILSCNKQLAIRMVHGCGSIISK